MERSQLSLKPTASFGLGSRDFRGTRWLSMVRSWKTPVLRDMYGNGAVGIAVYLFVAFATTAAGIVV